MTSEGPLSLEEWWDKVRKACPTKTWTIVLVQRAHEQFGSMWWAYAEPGLLDEPDPHQRVLMRANSTHTIRNRAMAGLVRVLEEHYPKEDHGGVLEKGPPI